MRSVAMQTKCKPNQPVVVLVELLFIYMIYVRWLKWWCGWECACLSGQNSPTPARPTPWRKCSGIHTEHAQLSGERNLEDAIPHNFVSLPQCQRQHNYLKMK